MDPYNNVTYGSGDFDVFPGTDLSQIEGRIVSWLETKCITMTDPLQKKDDYYLNSKKKIEHFKSLHSLSKLTESTQSIKSMESFVSLPSINNIERKSLQIQGEGVSFLKESNTWKLKNRRRTGDSLTLPVGGNDN